MKRFITLTTLITLLAACVPSTPASPTATASPVPQVSVRIVSYNILFGAGIDPEWYEHVSRSRRKDRTPELFAYLRELDADVVALQEAYGWDDSQPPFVATAARELGLPNYYVATSATDHDTAILTRYEILEAETVMRDSGSPGILRARLRTPDGNPLNVFVVHLDPFQDEARFCELDLLLGAVRPYMNERTILLGDFNFRPKTDEGRASPELIYLREAGLDMVAHDNTLLRDYIWVPGSSPAWSGRTWFKNPQNGPFISDHMPIGKQFDYFPYEAVPTPVSAPAKANELPALLQEKLVHPVVEVDNTFENACRNRMWFPSESTLEFQDGSLVVTGTENWSTNVVLPGGLHAGAGIAMRFRASQDSEFSVYIASDGAWGSENYRELGLYSPDERMRPYQNYGLDLIMQEDHPAILQPGHDYFLALLADKDARMRAYVWDPANPDFRFEYALETEDNFRDRVWTVIVSANRGVITVDEFLRLSFDGFQ